MEAKIKIDKSVEIRLDLANSYEFVNYQTDIYYKRYKKSQKQTPYSLIKNIFIKNNTDKHFKNLVLKFDVNDSILKINDFNISDLYPYSEVKASENINVSFDCNRLINLKESLPIHINVELYEKDNLETALVNVGEDITINPLDQVCSLASNDSSLLACLVTPNTREIQILFQKAKDKLAILRPEQPDFHGYLSNDINAVRLEMQAIYQAFVEHGIRYCLPPASYNFFQRVRTPDHVLKTREGTCIDLAVAYCSLCEAAGLRPIIVVLNDHAMAGCFLEECGLTDFSTEKVEYIVNNSSVGNMKLEIVDTVSMVLNNTIVPFNTACEAAHERLDLYKGYFKAIDVFKCHKAYYRPIPEFNDGEIITPESILNSYEEEIKTLVDNLGEFKAKKEKVTKFDYWAKKLLDLNLGNKLINFDFKGTAQLNMSDINVLYNNIQSDNDLALTFSGKPNRNGIPNKSDSVYIEDERNGSYLVFDSEAHYKTLVKKANSTIEETGSNILYLAIGLISFKPKDSVKDFYAPLFLVPVKGKIRSTNGVFMLDVVSDEITLNTTVLEYIKQTCGVDFDELYSAKAEDIYKNRLSIINTIRNRSSEACRLLVDENKCAIATFSFAHYIMWDDIKKRKNILMRNNIIKSLVDNTPIPDVEIEKSMDEIAPEDLAIPLGADSSQIKAIIDAQEGASFVLDGPPGTGKSQTIVNMIINAVYHGKTVLFVAEKMAALEVVKKRIDDLGLGFLCLELHSNKSNKSLMLRHLHEAMEVSRLQHPGNFIAKSNHLMGCRENLNELVKKMSVSTYDGVSLYNAVIEYLRVQEYDNQNYQDYDDALILTSEDKFNIKNAIKDLIAYSATRMEVYQNPFSAFTYTTYNKANDNDQFKLDLIKLSDALKAYQTAYNEFNGLFAGIPLTLENMNKMDSIFNYMFKKPCIFQTMKVVDFNKSLNKMKGFFTQAMSVRNSYSFLIQSFKSEIFDLDLLDLTEKATALKDDNLGFFKKYSYQKDIKKFYKQYGINSVKPEGDYEPNLIFPMINSIKACLIEYDKLENPFKSFFGDIMTCDYMNKVEVLDNTLKLYKMILKLTNNDEDLYLELLKGLEKLFENDEPDDLDQFNDISEAAKGVNDAIKHLTDKWKLDVTYFAALNEFNFPTKTIKVIENMVDNIDLADHMKTFNMLFNRLKDAHFPEMVLLDHRLGKFSIREIYNRYQAAYFRRLIKEYTKDPFFSSFNSILFNESVAKYGEAIEKYAKIMVQEVAARATKKYPSLTTQYGESTKINQLNKYIRSGGKNTTIRNLLSDFETEIKNLCPVFLMSPMSAAQYLKADSNKKFDIVIFDEASQIPTAEAIGAISRGKSLIVAGDPEQMPPTNFFKTNVVDNSEFAGVVYDEDLESLLDDCIAIRMKRNRLLWHYRSKHESLIAFSNNEFYHHDLYTFPSPDNARSCIKFKPVTNGIYDHGVNILEAKEIIKEVKRIFKDPTLQRKSIGIVTFNIKQCELINDMINEFFDSDKQADEINNTNQDKLFVKNLENVQGDERDIIIFSIGFGYNKDHKISMMFGPLSMDKGERRLNVAITRAREQMLVYSSITHRDIRLEGATNRGSLILKNFLEYAEEGSSTLITESSNQTNPIIGVEEMIQKDLASYGYDSDINVGDSKFRVNLCVKDQSGYILGIMLDGDGYLKTKTCRDRNYVQEKMLKSLSWQIMRVYTYDYYNNRDEVIQDIINKIEQVMYINENGGDEEDVNLSDIDNVNKKISTDDFIKDTRDCYIHRRNYQVYLPEEIYDFTNSGKDMYYNNVSDYLMKVVDNEGPISKSLLFLRFKAAYGIVKATPIARTIFGEMMDKIATFRFKELEKDEEYYYPKNLDSSNITYFRQSSYLDRKLEQIPYVEIAYALFDIIHEQGTLTLDDALKLLVKLFGYEKVTKQAETKMMDKIQTVIVEKGMFEVIDGKIDIIKRK